MVKRVALATQQTEHFDGTGIGKGDEPEGLADGFKRMMGTFYKQGDELMVSLLFDWREHSFKLLRPGK